MKIKLVVRKQHAIVYEDIHEVRDAESFGRVFSDVWSRLQDRRMQETTSIGALMEAISEDLIGDLDGAQINFEKCD